jgi:hypothetical protein
MILQPDSLWLHLAPFAMLITKETPPPDLHRRACPVVHKFQKVFGEPKLLIQPFNPD